LKANASGLFVMRFCTKLTFSMWIVNPKWLPWKANILHRPL
jgi:hypothetical protein